MSSKMVVSILFIITFIGLLAVPMSGCGQPTTTSVSTSSTLPRPLLDQETHSSEETAYFALGWFWGSDSQFGSIQGVIRTRVGYSGGTTANPTYNNIGNYSETVEVVFDPTVVTYEQLLAAFWNGHDATFPAYSTQYRSAIFYLSAQQRDLATQYQKDLEAKTGKTIYTDIEAFTGFTIAEDYHQKYYLRDRSELADELYAIYPDPSDFRDSTAAARINGYLGGHGDEETLEQNLDKLGLSEAGKEVLLQLTQSGLSPFCPVSVPGE